MSQSANDDTNMTAAQMSSDYPLVVLNEELKKEIREGINEGAFDEALARVLHDMQPNPNDEIYVKQETLQTLLNETLTQNMINGIITVAFENETANMQMTEQQAETSNSSNELNAMITEMRESITQLCQQLDNLLNNMKYLQGQLEVCEQSIAVEVQHARDAILKTMENTTETAQAKHEQSKASKSGYYNMQSQNLKRHTTVSFKLSPQSSCHNIELLPNKLGKFRVIKESCMKPERKTVKKLYKKMYIDGKMPDTYATVEEEDTKDAGKYIILGKDYDLVPIRTAKQMSYKKLLKQHGNTVPENHNEVKHNAIEPTKLQQMLAEENQKVFNVLNVAKSEFSLALNRIRNSPYLMPNRPQQCKLSETQQKTPDSIRQYHKERCIGYFLELNQNED